MFIIFYVDVAITIKIAKSNQSDQHITNNTAQKSETKIIRINSIGRLFSQWNQDWFKSKFLESIVSIQCNNK
ncbi:hypothetical protein DERP_008098 [Dermatophagoides pteronyssinus]|uniref:Uncharacterized protein n=1 Tax=Dermatophagoides pteronyssinus TaxID=6956 RepID=A0ABQ8JKA4_DERPT|nr:hypothetical protein DERP_008098 [Dermatophagoides pteronyssinus]